MKDTFLKQVAEAYSARKNHQDYCFVLPTRRAEHTFVREMHSTGIRWFSVTTVGEFLANVCGSEATNELSLLLELYETYKGINPKAEPLDEFIFWGRAMLADFDAIDRHMADARSLLVNVAEYKAGTADLSFLTDVQEAAVRRLAEQLGSATDTVRTSFRRTWDLLYPLYRAFRERLRGKGMAYTGMLLRDAAEKAAAGQTPELGHKTYVFVGLNALSKSEHVILKSLRDARKAEFVWDCASGEMRDASNPASRFIRENVRDLPQAVDIPAVDSRPDVTLVGVPSSTGMAKCVPQLLSVCSGTPGDTLIVLADGGLLLPLLSAIPESYASVNATMGYPLKRTAAWQLAHAVGALRAEEAASRATFTRSSVEAVLSSSLVDAALSEEEKDAVKAVRVYPKTVIPAEMLCKGPILRTIFEAPDSEPLSDIERNHAAERRTADILRMVTDAIGDDDAAALEKSAALTIIETLESLSGKDLAVSPVTHLATVDALTSAGSIPFEGNDPEALQVMGMLETRSLDFRNVIILGANEDLFPSKRNDASFIPVALRRAFGLPTPDYADAMHAYYFYRLIQRAEKVWMVYDNRTGGLLSGEESRYAKQLRYLYGYDLHDTTARPAFSSLSAAAGEIAKTADHIEALRSGHLSASAMQDYLSCPAKFYYRVVRRIRPDSTPAGVLDNAGVGNVFHKTMQTLYSPYRRLTPADIRTLSSDKAAIRTLVETGILEEAGVTSVSGRNILLADVITEWVLGTLKRDLELLIVSGSAAFRIIGLERKVTAEIEGLPFIGFIDRIDSYRDGQVRIVDYKTGRVEDDDILVTDKNAVAVADKLFGESNTGRPKIALQLYLYGVFAREGIVREDEQVVNSIYSTARTMTDPLPDVPVSQVFMDTVGERLKEVIGEIKDASVPWKRTCDRSACEWCDFRAICGR